MTRFRRSVLRKPSAETGEETASLLIKIIGETISSRIIRAILVGAVSGGTYYMNDTDRPDDVKLIRVAPSAPTPSAPASAVTPQ